MVKGAKKNNEDKKMKNEYYGGKELEDLCVTPFCQNLRLPDELGLCNECFNALTKTMPFRKIYDYSKKEPKLLITLKEALEKIIEHGNSGAAFRKLRFSDEPCWDCKEKQKRTAEKRNYSGSNSQKEVKKNVK